MKHRISDKGQVTIPKRLRDQLGIEPGDELAFEAEEGRIIVTKLEHRDAIDELYGSLKLPMSVDAWVDELRGPAVPPPEGER